MTLTSEQRTELLGLLAGERADLVGQEASLAKTFDELVAAADLEPPDDEHDPDGTTAYERAQVVSMLASVRQRLTTVAAAQQATEAGSYGTCASCDEPIPFDRLAAILGTDRCVTCAAGRDGTAT